MESLPQASAGQPCLGTWRALQLCPRGCSSSLSVNLELHGCGGPGCLLGTGIFVIKQVKASRLNRGHPLGCEVWVGDLMSPGMVCEL